MGNPPIMQVGAAFILYWLRLYIILECMLCQTSRQIVRVHGNKQAAIIIAHRYVCCCTLLALSINILYCAWNHGRTIISPGLCCRQ